MTLRVPSRLSAADERIVQEAIDCGFAIHRALGPGFRERIYQRAYVLELEDRKLRFESEKPILVRYKQWSIPGQTVDLIVEGMVLVEIKSVSRLHDIHRLQVLSYLRTLNLRVGLLMNFNVALFKNGLQRIVN
jgi:iron complex transport system substrate-binding protein